MRSPCTRRPYARTHLRGHGIRKKTNNRETVGTFFWGTSNDFMRGQVAVDRKRPGLIHGRPFGITAANRPPIFRFVFVSFVSTKFVFGQPKHDTVVSEMFVLLFRNRRSPIDLPPLFNVFPNEYARGVKREPTVLTASNVRQISFLFFIFYS